jgi:hypothetical protein
MYSGQGATATVTVQHGRCATKGDRVELKSKRRISCCWNCGTSLDCFGFFEGNTELFERVQRECPWLVKELEKNVPRRIWPIPTHNEDEFLGRACSRGCAQSVIEAERRGDNAAAHLALHAMDAGTSSGTSNNKLLLHKYGGVVRDFFSQDLPDSPDLRPQCADAMFAFRILPQNEKRQKYTGVYEPEPQRQVQLEPEPAPEREPEPEPEPEPELEPEREPEPEPEPEDIESDLDFEPEPDDVGLEPPEPLEPKPELPKAIFSFQKRRAKKDSTTRSKRSKFQVFKF